MTIRQFNMLAQFTRRDFTIEQALSLEQRTFGTLCKHHWVAFNAENSKFFLASHGQGVFSEFNDHKRLFRTNTSRPFSVFVPRRAKRVIYIRQRVA